MGLADYECQCGEITEHLTTGSLPNKIKCKCGGLAKRIFTLGRQQGSQEAPAWIKLTAETAGDSKEAVELRRHPNRTNLKKYMKARGVRFDEGNEKPEPKMTREQMRERNINIAHNTLRRMRRIEI